VTVLWNCQAVYTSISLGGALAALGDSAWARVYCRWICMDGFEGLVRDMLD